MRKFIIAGILVFFTATSNLYAQWTTSGSNIYNSNSGNVGIGTATPLEKLHINNGNLVLTHDLNQLTMGTIKFSSAAYNYAWSGISGMTNGQGWDQMDLAFYTAYGSPSEKMRLMSQTGFLGVGTSAPSAQIHSMSTGEQLRLGYDASHYTSFITSAAGQLVVTPSGGHLDLQTTEVNFVGQQPGQYQNSNSARLDFVGLNQSAGFGIQALNTAYYGTKDLVFYAHNGFVHNDYTSYDEVVRFKFDGSVGIGTSSPHAKLDVNGKVFIGVSDANTATQIAPYSLAVDGAAIFTKAVVKLKTNWPDYVFKPGYKLPKLDSLEQFVKTNQHLPGLPTSEEVAKNGIDLGSNQAQLLKKIEELTLIVIEQNKQSEKLKKIIENQQKIDQLQTKKISELEKELDMLKEK